jgi:hypothetical protein
MKLADVELARLKLMEAQYKIGKLGSVGKEVDIAVAQVGEAEPSSRSTSGPTSSRRLPAERPAPR